MTAIRTNPDIMILRDIVCEIIPTWMGSYRMWLDDCKESIWDKTGDENRTALDQTNRDNESLKQLENMSVKFTCTCEGWISDANGFVVHVRFLKDSGSEGQLPP